MRGRGSGTPSFGLLLLLALDFAELDRADEELGDVDDLEGLFALAGGLLGVAGVAEHDGAVGAGGGAGVGVEREPLLYSICFYPLSLPLFQPFAGAPCPAAEPAVPATLHLLGLGAGDGLAQ